MSTTETLQGLTCPNCGGVLSVPEGQAIVRCPYCDLRSLVRGERGVRRYQVPQRITGEQAAKALRSFFSNWAIARDCGRTAQLTESFLVYLPFWTVWGRVAAWGFGQVQEGSGDHKHYEPREVRIVQEMTWNGAACDVGEFGVNQVTLPAEGLEAFNPDSLHQAGMVFEPVGSFSDARQAAENQFTEQVKRASKLDRTSQLFVRPLRRRFGLVYYPLWVMRYLYRGRAFQVVVDGFTGKVLYGKAPGNTLYRAAVLVAGMAGGAVVGIDLPALVLSSSNRSSDNSGGFALVLFLVGMAMMYGSYRTFRYGEQYEYRSGPKLTQLGVPLETLAQVKDIEAWVSKLS